MGKLALNALEFALSLTTNLPNDPCDLYVFGFQELCSTLDGCFPLTVDKHLIEINRILLLALKLKYGSANNTNYNFTTIGMHNAGAVGIIAITPFVLKFSNARFGDAACGYASSLTKGGVGLRVKYICEDTSITELTFANAHICALEGQLRYQRRIDDLLSIMRAMDFGDNYNYLKPNCHAFFMGDLNFRTSKLGNIPVKDLLDLPQNPAVDPLEPDKKLEQYIVSLVKEYDELTAGRENGEIFSGFEESPISFHPTYKYHLGTAIYNSLRSPLWCDRILWQATYERGSGPVVHKYSSMPLYLRLDHRPVFLHITIPTKAPNSIIDRNGHLILLPRNFGGANSQNLKLIDAVNEISGPTQTYMKATPLDKIRQHLLRRVSDAVLGYGLWFSKTSSGRLLFLAIVIFAWISYYV